MILDAIALAIGVVLGCLMPSGKWLTTFGDWLIQRSMRTPYYHLDGYMNRWWLIAYRNDSGNGTGPVTWRRPIAKLFQCFNISVRIHQILRSDVGRDPHDHPFNYLTIVLRGGYREERYDDLGDMVSSAWHGPGSIMFRRSNSWHRLVLPAHASAWTLFITGKKADSTWGFNVDGTKVPHKDHETCQRFRP